MVDKFLFNADVEFTSSGLDKILSDAKRGLNSLKATNVPINFVGKNGSPLDTSSLAKSINLDPISKQVEKIGKKVAGANSELTKFGEQASATVKRFSAFLLIANSFNSVSNAIQASYSKAIQFEKQINKVSQVTGTAYKDLGGLTSEIRRLSIGLGVSSDSLANVALTLAQAGISARDTKKALDVLAKTELSATFDNINNTTEAAIAIMAQFGTSVDDLGGQLSAINSISAKFAVESSDLATSIRRTGGAFQATGGDLNELLALFTSVRATTRESAESISTGLRTIFTRLQRTRTVNFLSELGIELKDSKGQFIGVYESIRTLSTALKDIKGSDPRFSQIVEELGGFRQVSKVIPLLKQFEISEKALAVARRSNNSLDRDAATAQETLANKIQKTKEEFDALIASYSNNTFLRSATQLALGLASALIKVGQALEPLIPAITLLGGSALVKSVPAVAKGFFGGSGKSLKLKSGGMVPGSGSGDIVPAMLEPGEFVLKKSAVQAFGAANASHINKYAGGGKVGSSIVSRKNIARILESFSADTGVNPLDVVNGVTIKNRHKKVPDAQGSFGTIDSGGTTLKAIQLFSSKINSPSQLKRVLYHELGHAVDHRGVDSAGKNIFASQTDETYQNYVAQNYKSIQKNSLNKKGASEAFSGYALSNPELFANGFSYAYNGGKTNTRKKFLDSTSYALSNIAKKTRNGQVSSPSNSIEELLQPGFLNLGQPKRLGSMRRYAGGGIVRALQGLVGYDRKMSLKNNFLGSLGVSKRNWFSGDEGYISGSRVYGPKQEVVPLQNSNAISSAAKTLSSPSLDKSGNFVTGRNIKIILGRIQKEQGIRFDDDLVSRVKITNSNRATSAQKKELARLGLSGFKGSFNAGSRQITLNRDKISSLEELRAILLHELGHAIDAKVGSGKYASEQAGTKANSFGRSNSKILARQFGDNKYKTSLKESFAELLKDYLTGNINPSLSSLKIKKEILAKVSKVKKYAGGGTVSGFGDGDTVPALLTPGEVVINKKSAQAFGYGKLNRINKYAKGGIVNPTTLALGLTAAPALIDTVASTRLPDSAEYLKPFLSALTVAGGALLAFSFGIKKDTGELAESLTSLKERSGDTAKQIGNLQGRAKLYGQTIVSGTSEVMAPVSNPFSPPQTLKDADGNPVINRSVGARRAQRALGRNIIQQGALKNEQAAINKELLTAQTTLDKTNKDNARNLKVAIGAAIVSAIGSGVEGYASRNAALGNKSTFGISTSIAAGIGGALSGAGNGALAGAALGSVLPLPPGITQLGTAAIGAGIGGTVGGVTSFLGARDTSKQFSAQTEIEKLNKALSKVGSGRSTFSEQSGNISTGIGYINKQFLELSNSELPAFTAQLDATINGLDDLFRSGVESSTSLDEFRKKNEGLILALSRFGGETIPELESRANTLIKAQTNQVKATEQATQNAERLRAVFNISGAVGDAERSIHQLSSSLSSLEEIVSGNFGPALSNIDFSALSNIGSANINDVTSQATRAGGLIGGPAVQLGKDVSEAAALANKIPSILNEVINGNQLEGGDITDKLRERLGKGFGADLFIEAINKEIGATSNSVEIIKKFKQDPVGIAKNIQAAIDPLVSALSEATPKITAQFDQFATGLATARGNFIQSLDGLVDSINIQQTGAEFNANLTGKSLSFSENQAFDTRRFQAVAGTNSSPSELANRLRVANENIQDIEGQRNLSNTPAEFKDLTVALEANKKEAEIVNRSLEYLADVNSRLATSQKELQRLQSERQNKAALAKDFTFGSPSEQRDIIKGLVGVRTILGNQKAGNSPLQGVSLEMRKLALGIFEQYSEDKVFNGKTGREALNSISGSPFGIDFNQPGPKEKEAIEAGQTAIKQAEDARKILNENLVSNNEKFLTGLSERFDKFFVELNKSFAERASNELKTRTGQRDVELSGIGGKTDFLRFVQQTTGKNVNDKGIVAALKNNIAPIERIKTISDEIPDLIGAGVNFRRGGYKDSYQLESFLGKDFTKQISGLTTDRQKDDFTSLAVNQGVNKRLEEQKTLTKEVETSLGGVINPIIQNLKKFKDGLEQLNAGDTLNSLTNKETEIRNKPLSMGGIIGLANGGSVFKKRGTDTVPAMTTDGRPYMLTPGEMVMNTKAVGKYGSALKGMNAGYLANGGAVNSRRFKPTQIQYVKNTTSGGRDYYVYEATRYDTLKEAEVGKKKYDISEQAAQDRYDASQRDPVFLGRQYAEKKRAEAKAFNNEAEKRGAQLSALDITQTGGGSYQPSSMSGLTPGGVKVAQELENKRLSGMNDSFYGKSQTLAPLANSEVDLYKEQQKFFGGGPKIRSVNDVAKEVDAGAPNPDLIRLETLNRNSKLGVIPRRDTSFVDKMSAERLKREGAARKRNNINNLDVKENRNSEIQSSRYDYQHQVNQSIINGKTPEEAKKKADSLLGGNIDPRRQFQRQRSTLIAQGVSPIEASQQLLKNNGTTIKPGSGQAFFSPQSQNPVKPGNIAHTSINPKLMEEFNSAVNKLAGTKLEITLNGTLDIRIIEGNLAESINKKFAAAAEEYVDNKITNAINTLVKENGLAQAPKSINRGAQPK